MGSESEEIGEYSGPKVGGFVELPGPVFSSAGYIQNIDKLLPTSWASIIHSVAGSTRSGHWHRNDYHYLYVLGGEMNYYEWDPSYEHSKDIISGMVAMPMLRAIKGACVFTPPGRAHWTVFPEDTILLSLSRLPRDHESHEKDVVRL